jgi:hypothetical protein
LEASTPKNKVTTPGPPNCLNPSSAVAGEGRIATVARMAMIIWSVCFIELSFSVVGVLLIRTL